MRAWNRNEVRITGSLGEGVEKLVIDGDRDHLVVRVQYPKHIGAWRGDRTGPTDLQLQVPLQADLEIESVSADIDVDGVAPGEFDIDTVSGNVVAAAAPKSADINSVSGDLQVTLNSRDVKVETVSGDVRLQGRLDGEVHGETVSGALSIDSRSQRLRSSSPPRFPATPTCAWRWPTAARSRPKPSAATSAWSLPKIAVGAGQRRELQRRPARARREDRERGIRPGFELPAALWQRRRRGAPGDVLGRRRAHAELSRIAAGMLRGTWSLESADVRRRHRAGRAGRAAAPVFPGAGDVPVDASRWA